jgi:hypothetical protein
MFNIKSVFRTLSLAVLSASLFIAGCKDDDSTTEQENITTIVVHLTGDNGFDQEFTWNDPDGAGGTAPAIDTIVIPANAGDSIHCHLHVYDESKTPTENITEEIEAENTVHLFIYKVTGADLAIAYADADDNGGNFGLETTWTKGATSSGTVEIVLHHEPTNKDDLNNPGGEVDFDVTFPVKIQ